MIGFIEGFLVSVTTSLLYDIIKKRFIGDEGIKHFKKAVSDTIEYFHKQGIELQEDYFTKTMEDKKVTDAVALFKEGEDYISNEVLVESFLETDFFMLTKANRDKKAKEIIEFFTKQLTKEILKDTRTSVIYLNSILRINFKKSNEFVRKLHENTKLALDEIILRLNIIEQKQDEGLKKDDIIINEVSDIKKMLSKKILRGEDLKDSNKEFQSKLDIANDLFDKELYDTARDKYLEMLTIDSLTNEEKWKLNRNIAMTYLITNEFEKAIPYFNKAFNALPNEDRGKLQKIYALMLEGSNKEALEEFNKIFGSKDLNDEERVLKMNILMKLKKLSEAESLFDDDSLKNPDNRYAYSRILYEMKDFQNAQEQIQEVLKVKKRAEILLEYGIYKLTPIIDKINKEKILRLRYSEEMKSEVFQVIKIFNEARVLSEKTQNKKEYASAIFNRGIAYSCIGKEDECIGDFETAEKLGLEGFEIFLNIGVSYMRTGKFKKALIYFKKCYNIEPLKALPYLLDVLLFCQEYSELRRICEEHTSYPKLDINLDNLIMYLYLAIIFNKELDTLEADKILLKVERFYPNNFQFVNTKAKILWERKEKNQAIEFLEKKKDDVTSDKDVIILKLADYYFATNQWDYAKKIYEKYLDIDDIFNFNYMSCLYNLKKYNDVIEFSTGILEKNKIENEYKIKEILGYSYLALDNFKEASPIFKELSIKFQNSHYYYNWAYCETRLNNLESALIIANEAEKEFKGKYKELSMISAMYFNIGEKKKALDIAYESATNLPEDPEVNENFINIINFMVNDAGLVSEEQKNLYNHLMGNWDSLFPEIKLFEKIPIESDFKTIIKKLEERSKYGQQIISMYEKRQIPLTLYSKQSGLNIYAVWKDLISSYLMKIYTNNPRTIKKQLQTIRDSKKIVIDPFSFFTMFELGIHQYLLKVFDEIYFTQGLLDALIQHKAELEISSVQGKNTIGIMDGKLYRTEVSAENVKKEIMLVDEMIDFIKPFIRGNKRLFIDKRISDMIENSSTQSINLSLELNIPLLCDDSLLNDIIVSGFDNYKYSSSLWFIQKLADRGIINNHQFNSYILRLVSMNYYFIPLSADILLEGIEEINFNEYSLNKRAIDNFRDIHQDRNTAFFVIADFIIKIYFNKKLAVITRDNWVDYILNAITINDSDAEKTFDEIKSIVIKSAEETKRNLRINDKIIKDFIDWINKIIGMR